MEAAAQLPKFISTFRFDDFVRKIQTTAQKFQHSYFKSIPIDSYITDTIRCKFLDDKWRLMYSCYGESMASESTEEFRGIQVDMGTRKLAFNP